MFPANKLTSGSEYEPNLPPQGCPTPELEHLTAWVVGCCPPGTVRTVIRRQRRRNILVAVYDAKQPFHYFLK